MSWLRCLGLAGLLGVVPASAMTLEDCRSFFLNFQALRNSRALADSLPATVAICLQRRPDLQPGIASGIYLGLDPDRKTGYVLTAAHSFFAESTSREPLKPLWAQVRFGVNGPTTLAPFGTRVRIHPDRTPYTIGEDKTRHPGQADLAILEFDPKPILADLEALGFRPARLYPGLQESKVTRFEARIVGAGPYAAGGNISFLPGPRALAGHAWVDLTSFLGRTGFYNWQLAKSPADEEDGGPRPAPFWLPAQPWTLRAYGADAEFALQAAKAPQAAINSGDSGGPLFLESEGDWLLAGIACRSQFEDVQANGKTYSGRVTFWEALTGANLSWVQAVLAGTSDQGAVVTIPIPAKVEPGSQAEPAVGTAAGARTGETKAAETKAVRTEAGDSKDGRADPSAPVAGAADPG